MQIGGGSSGGSVHSGALSLSSQAALFRFRFRFLQCSALRSRLLAGWVRECANGRARQLGKRGLAIAPEERWGYGCEVPISCALQVRDWTEQAFGGRTRRRVGAKGL